jgi:hypothetical protein
MGKTNNIEETSKDLNVEYDASNDVKFEERSKTTIIRDDKSLITVGDQQIGRIKSYKFTILIHNEPDLMGELSREEMNMIYQFYSAEGANLTQRQTCRYFPQYTLRNFKRILRAFNITKACSPLAPHIIEEHSVDELVELGWKSKEDSYLRRFEQQRNKLAEDKLKDVLKENFELKNQVETLSNIDFNIKIPEHKYPKIEANNSGKSIMIHLADLHVGAKVESASLYNNSYGKEEIYKRMTNLIDNIYFLGNEKYETIILNILGDNLDGIDAQTARRDHYLPQNMDNLEQINTFIEVMEYFIVHLNRICNNLKIYSVNSGNHDGATGYASTKALLYKINALYPEVETKLFDTFFGCYEFNSERWVICHGKDSKFMKKGLPLNLDEKSKIMIYEWLDDNQIFGNNIHIIKGDLHSDNFNSCLRFDYRTCLSFFGSSDYSNYNFSRNNYGVSYELFQNNTSTKGTFVNL